MAQLSPYRALQLTENNGGKSLNPLFSINETLTAGLFLNWLETGLLKQMTAPAILICELEFSRFGQKQTVKGLICPVQAEGDALSCMEPEPAQVKDMTAFMEQTGFQPRPVTALYDDVSRETWSRITLLSSGKPRFSFTESGVTHRVWVINDLMVIAALRADFELRRLFLADGIEVYESALNLRQNEKSSSVLTFLVDAGQGGLTVLPSHLLYFSPEPLNQELLFSRSEPYFRKIARSGEQEITANLDALYRQGKKAFACYTGGSDWTLFILREDSTYDEPTLHRLVTEMLSVPAQQSDSAFTRTASVEAALTQVQSGKARAAFLFSAPRLLELRTLAESEKKLPPHAYFFYPASPEEFGLSIDTQ